jgi:6-phosphogluconolactonase (cycloisomerase 2 family)
MKACFKFWSAVSIGLTLLAQSLSAEILYLADGKGNRIFTYRITAYGGLASVTGSPISTGLTPASLAVDTFGHFLYAANSGENSISAYKIGGTGGLTPLGKAQAGIAPVSVAVDPFGRFVYVANLGNDVPPQSSNVSSFRIAKNGTLAPVIGSPFSSGILPIAVVADPFGRYVYAANSGTQELDTENIAGYRVAQNGALKPLQNSPFANGEGPESAAMDPWGRFLYVANFYDGVLSVCRIAGNGNLTPVAGSPFATTPASSIVVVDPLGRFLYVANSFEPAISVYRIAGNGSLTQLHGSPFQVETEPDSMVIDLTGRFLYLANETGVSAYRIAGNGTFSPLPGSPFATGFSPSAMAISP